MLNILHSSNCQKCILRTSEVALTGEQQSSATNVSDRSVVCYFLDISCSCRGRLLEGHVTNKYADTWLPRVVRVVILEAHCSILYLQIVKKCRVYRNCFIGELYSLTGRTASIMLNLKMIFEELYDAETKTSRLNAGECKLVKYWYGTL